MRQNKQQRRERILKSVEKLVEKEKISADDAEKSMGRIVFTTDMDALHDVDFVVEAVIENIDLKEELYTALGQICQPKTIFGSNTSSLSIAGTYRTTNRLRCKLNDIFLILSKLNFRG